MEEVSKYIKSPLCYIGGKYKILNQILPLFPENIDTFVDLFGGGFNVGMNVNARRIVYNDVLTQLCNLMTFFYTSDTDDFISKIKCNIQKHNLSKRNKDAYLELREEYNYDGSLSDELRIIDFFTLILYSFNHQIRFNKNMEFNVPFGKARSSFNVQAETKLKNFLNAMHQKNIFITNLSFEQMDFSEFTINDLIYCDPPYWITTGCYGSRDKNDNNWTKVDEFELLNFLSNLNENNIKFALSNVFRANGKTNRQLIEWSEQYNVHFINNSYNNCNYRRKYRDDVTEVLITNYD